MARTEKLTIYISEEKKGELEQRARDADESISGYASKLIDQQLLLLAEEDVSSEQMAEERLRALIAEGKDDLEAVASDIQQTERRRASYEIVNFLILKNELGIKEQHLNDLFEAANERLEATEPT
jgi:hypothetical protein